MDRRVPVGLALAAAGVGLIAAPLYLGYLLPYPTPGDGWRLTGIYYAQFVTLGFAALAVGGFALLGTGDISVRAAAAVALGSVVAVVAYHWLVFHLAWATLGRDAHDAFGGALVTPLSSPGREGVFIEFFLATLFVLGVLVQTRAVREHVDVLLGFGVVFVVSAATGSALTGLFGLVLAGLSPDLLGVRGVGIVLALAPFVLGLACNPLFGTSGRSEAGT